MIREASWAPRQRGVYAQLLVPLSCAWTQVSSWLPAAWLTTAALLWLLAGAPLGELRHRIPNARRNLTALVVTGLIALGFGLASASAPVTVLLLVPLALLGSAALMILQRRVRSLTGEVLVALALSSWSLPVAACGTLPRMDALWLWLPFGAFFGASTIAVRHLIPAARRRDRLSSGFVLGMSAALFWFALGAFLLGELSVGRALSLAPAILTAQSRLVQWQPSFRDT